MGEREIRESYFDYTAYMNDPENIDKCRGCRENVNCTLTGFRPCAHRECLIAVNCREEGESGKES